MMNKRVLIVAAMTSALPRKAFRRFEEMGTKDSAKGAMRTTTRPTRQAMAKIREHVEDFGRRLYPRKY